MLKYFELFCNTVLKKKTTPTLPLLRCQRLKKIDIQLEWLQDNSTWNGIIWMGVKLVLEKNQENRSKRLWWSRHQLEQQRGRVRRDVWEPRGTLHWRFYSLHTFLSCINKCLSTFLPVMKLDRDLHTETPYRTTLRPYCLHDTSQLQNINFAWKSRKVTNLILADTRLLSSPRTRDDTVFR